jgi:signal transduction histidine kinase
VVGEVRECFREPPPIECQVNVGITEVIADERIVRHVLANLLSNAVKYRRDDRPVELAVGRSDGDLEVIVRDHGIGIPSDDLPNLFESFHRGSNVGDVPGTGLGLAVVKRLVDRHGGSISVQSKQGEGATFVVTIPQEGSER